VILLLAAVVAGSAAIADWVPARWPSADPKSLDLLADTPSNCLLLEPDQATALLAEPAAKRGNATLVVLRPGGDTLAAARKALENQLTGVVLHGDFDEAAVRVLRDSLSGSKAPVIEMPPRRSLRPTASTPVLATYQSVWPGIPIAPNGAAKAGPTGTPWVNTNMGFLLFARAWTDAPVWVANAPPADQVLKVENYLQAICDAGVLGARWVLSLDPDFSRRLLARDAAALADWKRIATHLRYFEENKAWRSLTAHRGMTVIQDADSGALVSGGLLDMIAVKHTPVRVVPRQKLSEDMVRGSRVLLNLEAPLLSAAQKDVVTRFTHSGGLLLTSPPEVKMPALRDDAITIEEKELKEIEVLWRDINQIIWHQSLGAKPYHAAGMLSRTLTSEDGKRVILHLVNYTNYPVENVTVRFPATFRRARLLTPEAAPKDLETYEMEKTTAVDIDQVPVCATVIVE